MIGNGAPRATNRAPVSEELDVGKSLMAKNVQGKKTKGLATTLIINPGLQII